MARHAGHHRPGDRERLLLRLLPQPAVHAGRPARHRKEDEARSSRATNPSPRRCGRARRRSRRFRDMGEQFKVELVDAIPEDQQIKIYKQGDWFDLCRGPHMTSTGKVGNAFKLMKVAGAYWRGDFNNPMLTRIYGTAFAKQEELDALSQADGGSREARPPQARPRDGPLPFPGGRPRHRVLARRAAGRCSRRSSPICAAGSKGDYQEVNAPQLLDKSLWETSGHWGWFRENMFQATVGRRAHRRQARVRDQADELPGPYPDLQARAALAIASCRCGWPNSASCTATSRPARCTGCCACAPSRRTTRTSSAPKSRWPRSA